MNKIVKRILVTLLVVCLVCGAIAGGLFYAKNSQKSAVNVYDVSYFANSGEHWGNNSTSYGMVTVDKLQNVYLSETQQVKEVFVTEGQQVKVGDPLVSYDTTLSDIALEKAATQVEKTRLSLEDAKKELETIKNMVPHYTVLVTPEFTPSDEKPRETPYFLGGEGTIDKPLCFLWQEGEMLDSEFLWGIAPEEPVKPEDPEDPSEPTDPSEPSDPSEPTEPEEPEDHKVYAIFISREDNIIDSRILGWFGMMVDRVDGQLYFRPYDAFIPAEYSYENIPQEPYYEEYGSMYTSAEIAQMRTEKEREIVDLDIQLKAEEVQLRQMQEEVNNGIVTAKLDGFVQNVMDPDAAVYSGMPLLQVSGGGGYYIEVALSELEMATVSIGQTVTVMDWRNGGSYEGKIIAMSEYPAENADSWSNGNNNVTYYPFTVFVDGSAQLREGSYAEVSYQAQNQEEADGFYLEKMFIRSENGQKYVMVQGENGKLEKRFVKTGGTLWDSYTMILDGLTMEDKIAFPYGKGVEEGAPTKEANIDEFYSMY